MASWAKWCYQKAIGSGFAGYRALCAPPAARHGSTYMWCCTRLYMTNCVFRTLYFKDTTMILSTQFYFAYVIMKKSLYIVISNKDFLYTWRDMTTYLLWHIAILGMNSFHFIFIDLLFCHLSQIHVLKF